jgi:hypothetical protein
VLVAVVVAVRECQVAVQQVEALELAVPLEADLKVVAAQELKLEIWGALRGAGLQMVVLELVVMHQAVEIV